MTSPADMNGLLRQMRSGGGLGTPLQQSAGSQSPREGGREGWDKPIPPYDIQGPSEPLPLPEQVDPNFRRGVTVPEYGEIDPRMVGEVNRNPEGADAGPFYMSPMAADWYQENVFDRGFTIDWGSGTAFNPDTGEEFRLPRYFENSQ